jgi:hypothetical protein
MKPQRALPITLLLSLLTCTMTIGGEGATAAGLSSPAAVPSPSPFVRPAPFPFPFTAPRRGGAWMDGSIARRHARQLQSERGGVATDGCRR